MKNFFVFLFLSFSLTVSSSNLFAQTGKDKAGSNKIIRGGGGVSLENNYQVRLQRCEDSREDLRDQLEALNCLHHCYRVGFDAYKNLVRQSIARNQVFSDIDIGMNFSLCKLQCEIEENIEDLEDLRSHR